jgi:hypothetical protein
MLQEEFVPVAIDQWYQRRQKDPEGDWWRKIAGQGPRNDFAQTTQGHYICDASGKLLGFNGNHVDLQRIRAFMEKGVEDFDADSCKAVTPIESGTPDTKFNFKPPVGGMVVRVRSKILDGYEKANDAAQSAFQNSVGQDNLWILESEKKALIDVARNDGDVPESIALRIARFHLIDNTRGEPPRWSGDEVKSIEMKVNKGRVTGKVRLETGNGDRGYDCELFGFIEASDGEISRFDMAAEGKFWGEGRFTRRAPKGKFPLAITFQLTDGSTAASHAIPHGGKGWIQGYYETGK